MICKMNKINDITIKLIGCNLILKAVLREMVKLEIELDNEKQKKNKKVVLQKPETKRP